MKLLCRLFRQDPDSREGTVVAVSALNILVNLIFAAVKVVIGMAVSSIAIISEGVNNATDSATSLITIVGTKLSAKHPTEKHPFGFGRIEYLTSLLISVLILFTGAELMESSVKLIFEPEEMTLSYTTMAIIAAFVRQREHVSSFHALYIHPNGRDVYVDLVVDYDLADWEGLRREFTDYMAACCPDKHLELVIETNYV